MNSKILLKNLKQFITEYENGLITEMELRDCLTDEINEFCSEQVECYKDRIKYIQTNL